MKDILVAVDGWAASRRALDVALRMGQLTRRTVCLLHIWTAPAAPVSPLGQDYLYDTFQEREDARSAALTLLDEELSRALRRRLSDEPVRIRVEERQGAVADEITAAAEDAALLVLGTRGRSWLGNLLRSPVTHVLHQVACPVVVVPRGPSHVLPFRRVVVGVDASDWSRAALHWAYELARLEGKELLAIHAVPWGDQPIPMEERVRWRASVLASLPDPPEVECSIELRAGRPHDVLAAAVDPDDLLVVGTRGSRGVADVVLGSVAEACVAHPSLPVLVVKAQAADLAEVFTASEPSAASS